MNAETQGILRGMRKAAALLLALLAAAPAGAATFQDSYLERYFDMYPGRATAAGRHDLDRRLEDLSPARRRAWLDFNLNAVEGLRRILAAPSTSPDDRLDAELLLRQAELEVFEYRTQARPVRDPLFWTEIAGNATVFLLVREDLPKPERLSRAAARAAQLPRLAAQAREALSFDPARIAPEICAVAAPSLRSAAAFYRAGFPSAAEGESAELRAEMKEAGEAAAAALEGLAVFLDGVQPKAKGKPRLGADYAARFRLVTGVEEPVERVLAGAVTALAARRAEAAAYGRSLWNDLMPGTEPPADDRELLRRLFERVSMDRASGMDEFVADYRKRHPRTVRALFADGVHVEGWGTFSERLLLDQGWGGPLDRLAHLKKQLENIARTIVDIRVNTQNMSQAQVLSFVKDEALQDEQFAANMWERAITSSPQLTFYYLGDREVQGLFDEVRATRGAAFDLKAFLDGMMEMGPVPIRHYWMRMLGREPKRPAEAPSEHVHGHAGHAGRAG